MSNFPWRTLIVCITVCVIVVYLSPAATTFAAVSSNPPGIIMSSNLEAPPLPKGKH